MPYPKLESRGLNKFGANPNLTQDTQASVWANGGLYVWPTQARVHDVVSSNPQDSGFALGLLTTTGNFSNTETVTIDEKVYTFQTSLTDVDGNVLIGSDAEESIDNLVAAITLAAGAGTTYATAMTLHPTCTAIKNTAAIMAAYAKTSGSDGAELIDEDLVLNGLVTVVTPDTYLGINRTFSKTGAKNAGAITLTAQTDATVSANIAIGKAQSQLAIYYVPSDRDLMMDTYFISVGKQANAAVSGELYIDSGSGIARLRHGIGAHSQGSTKSTHEFKPALRVPAGSKIDLRAESSASSTGVTGGFDGQFAAPLSS